MNIIRDPKCVVTRCRVCDFSDLELVLDLGDQPWCNNFLKKEQIGKEPHYSLRVVFCRRCSTPQLDYTVPKEVMFIDHTYVSHTTKTLTNHFGVVAEEVNNRFFKETKQKSVLDIGSNDGSQLKHYKNLGFEVLGVESARTIAKMANDAGIQTTHAFFNHGFAKSLGRKFHVINASGVFFHLEELHSVTEGIRESLHKNGIFVVQFLYMKKIVDNCAFDQIYHEHLLYYNLKNIQALLEQHGLQMFDAYISSVHGGSVIGYVSHQGKRVKSSRLETLEKVEEVCQCNDIDTYLNFAKRTAVLKQQNVSYLKNAKQSGKTIYGFGAPAKGNTLLNYFGISTETLYFLTEKNAMRRGLYSPGKHIPVIIEGEFTSTPDIYYVLAWNFRSEILANNQSLVDSGVEFYFPITPK